MLLRTEIPSVITSLAGKKLYRYVTSGFYDKSEIAKCMFQAFGEEIDGLTEFTKDLKHEIFPQTAGWSLGFFEYAYGIEADEHQTSEYRRQMILAKLLERPPLNPKRIIDFVKTLLEFDIDIEENIRDFVFKVCSIDLNLAELRAIHREVMRIKPSHLYFFNSAMYPNKFLTLGQLKRVETVHVPLLLDGETTLNGECLFNEILEKGIRPYRYWLQNRLRIGFFNLPLYLDENFIIDGSRVLDGILKGREKQYRYSNLNKSRFNFESFIGLNTANSLKLINKLSQVILQNLIRFKIGFFKLNLYFGGSCIMNGGYLIDGIREGQEKQYSYANRNKLKTSLSNFVDLSSTNSLKIMNKLNQIISQNLMRFRMGFFNLPLYLDESFIIDGNQALDGIFKGKEKQYEYANLNKVKFNFESFIGLNSANYLKLANKLNQVVLQNLMRFRIGFFNLPLYFNSSCTMNGGCLMDGIFKGKEKQYSYAERSKSKIKFDSFVKLDLINFVKVGNSLNQVISQNLARFRIRFLMRDGKHHLNGVLAGIKYSYTNLSKAKVDFSSLIRSYSTNGLKLTKSFDLNSSCIQKTISKFDGGLRFDGEEQLNNYKNIFKEKLI